MRRPAQDEVEQYGFRWGPIDVIRTAHVNGKGYWLEVVTDWERLTVYVTDKGFHIRTYIARQGPRKPTL